MKTVLLTGATKGLGLATARRLIADGYKVIGVSRSLSSAYDDLMTAHGPARIDFVSYDFDSCVGIPSLMSTITERHGVLYALINNAAIGADGLLATMHGSDITRSLRINLEAPIFMTKFACRRMLLQRAGRIVNITSIVARTGFSGLSVYAAAKAGLEGFTRSLARELGPSRITVNCVSPGFMETDMTRRLEADRLEAIRRRTPLGLATVEDAAAAVAYLLSDGARQVTGTTLTVDGGSCA